MSSPFLQVRAVGAVMCGAHILLEEFPTRQDFSEGKKANEASTCRACAASTSALSTLMTCLEICTGDMLALNIGRRTWLAGKNGVTWIMTILDGHSGGKWETGTSGVLLSSL